MPTKIPQDMESLTVPLFEVIPLSDDLEELLWKAASSLQGKTEVPAGKGRQILSYQVTRECEDLANAFDETKVEDIDRKLRTRGETIGKRELPLLVLESVSGPLSTTDKQVAAQFYLRKREDARKGATKDTPENRLKEAKLRCWGKRGKDFREEAVLSTRSAIVVSRSVAYETEPPVPLLTLRYPVILLEASGPAGRGGANQDVP